MHNLTGLVLSTRKQSHASIVGRIRTVLADRVTNEAAPDTLRLHVGTPVEGFTLLTDSSIVTFELELATAIAGDLPAALFATRDLGYRKGKSLTKGALLALNGWKRLRPRAAAPEALDACLGASGVVPVRAPPRATAARAFPLRAAHDGLDRAALGLARSDP